jgi:hypothetical protein
MEFTESLTLELPRIEASIAEAAATKKKGLVVELAAIHEGMTANFNHYSAEELEKALESWTTPYPKPIIRNHDVYTEPVGRVMDARMDTEEDGSPFVRLQVAITDAEAIEKVGDERYLTGSVGGKAGKALCSVCEKDWANISMFDEPPCAHERGKVYKGKLCYFKMQEISFKEYSFVNVPADQRSSIRSIGSDKETVTDSEESINDRPVIAHVYAMDMDKERVVELSESGERNLFAEMKKKDTAPFYHVLRGAFLTTLALAEAEAEETISMPTEDDDDILEVMESLEEEPVTEEETDAPEEETADEAAPEEDEEADPAEDEAADPEEDEEASEEDPADAPEEEEGRPEGQEKPHDADTPPPVEREGEEDGPEDEDPEEEPAEAPAEDPEEDATEPVEPDPEESDERISVLEAEVARLSEENAKLKGYFKTQLAERVVDTKIALGIEEADKRAELLEEHKARTASSLRDSIRDLGAITPAAPKEPTGAPTVESSVAAVGDDDGRSITTDVKDDNPTKTPQEQLIDGFVDVLMDRRRLN